MICFTTTSTSAPRFRGPSVYDTSNGIVVPRGIFPTSRLFTKITNWL